MRERSSIMTKFSLIFLIKISTRNQLSDSRSWVLYCRFDWIQRNILNHCMPIVSFYTPLKTLGNLRFSDNFKRCRKRKVAWVGLIVLSWKYRWEKKRNVFLCFCLVLCMSSFLGENWQNVILVVCFIWLFWDWCEFS